MRTPNTRVAALAMTALALALALSACGGTDATTADHNQADVSFATDMIPHHQQALEMVDLTEERPLDAEVSALAAGIAAAQAPEIEEMSGWLSDWDEPVPSASASDGMDEMDMSGEAMPGMMSSEDMAALGAASDDQFQRMWLTMMIDHHQGAIDMAKTEQADGSSAPAIALAKAIQDTQEGEIATMRQLLAG